MTSHDYKNMTAVAKMFLLVGGEGVGVRVSPSKTSIVPFPHLQ